MPFDGIVAHAVALELNRTLTGGRIGKITQPTRETVLIGVRAGGENHRLLACCSGADARLQLTQEEAQENPASPPMFCMLLRKHISGGIIRRVLCPGFERILILEIETEDELGDRSLKKLVVEVMGRHSNIILLNRDDVILDAARHVDEEISRVREILPARPYSLPPAQDKLDPSLPDMPEQVIRTVSASGRKLAGVLLETLRGFSPVLCREVCHQAGLDGDKAGTSCSPADLVQLSSVLSGYAARLAEGGFTPCTVTDPFKGRTADFHALPLTETGNPTIHPTLGAAMDAFFGERERSARLSARRAELARTVSNNLEKVQRRLAVQQATLDENAGFERLMRYGELLTSNIHALSEGMESATVSDWYSETGEMAVIPLDPSLSPQRNAQRYFRRYQKAKAACRYAESQFEGLNQEVSYLESLLYAIENAMLPSDFQEIREEMVSSGYLKPPAQKAGKGGKPKHPGKKPKAGGAAGNPPPADPLRIVSQDGFEIFIGRNNRQNDRLTLKMARAEDLWFHIKHFSGSHVVIRTAGKSVPDATVEEAAAYAAWYSKARQATKAEVDFTTIRNVRKPAGGKPGMVIYVNYKTANVAPKEPRTNS